VTDSEPAVIGSDAATNERLRRGLSDAIAAADPTLARRLEQDAEAHLDLLELTWRASREATQLLHASARSARLAGISWERIGLRLGMSRQAAQQRFGREPDDASSTEGTVRLSPVTAFDEMERLSASGRHGWHSVGYGMFYHDLARSDQQWEHRRVPAFGASRRALEAEGWERVGSMWFPWAYYTRCTGEPVEPGGDVLVTIDTPR
jgi:hypothetical protein